MFCGTRILGVHADILCGLVVLAQTWVCVEIVTKFLYEEAQTLCALWYGDVR